MRKAKRWVVVGAVVAVIIGLFGGAWLANAAWYYYSIPEGFDGPVCVGTWKSTKFFAIAGGLRAELPAKLAAPAQQPAELSGDAVFPVRAWIYYNLWSLYRPGSSTEVMLEGELQGSALTGEGAAVDPYGRELKLRGTLPDGLTIQYEAKPARPGRGYTGVYWAHPADAGVFELTNCPAPVP